MANRSTGPLVDVKLDRPGDDLRQDIDCSTGSRSNKYLENASQYPDHSYPDSPRAGSGLSKDEQDELVNEINSRASLSSLERNSARHNSTSHRYDESALSSAGAKYPDHSYPDSPRAGGGLSKDEQDAMVNEINSRASLSSLERYSASHSARHNSTSHRYDEGTLSSAGAKHPDHSYPDSPTAGRGMSKVEQDAMVNEINSRVARKKYQTATLISSKQNRGDVEAAHHLHPGEPFPDNMS